MSYFATPALRGPEALDFGAWRLAAGADAPARADPLMAEFPAVPAAVQGRAHAFAYYAGCSRRGRVMDCWVKASREGARLGAAVTPGALHLEPVFVPRARTGAEDDGALVGFVLRGGVAALKVVCAATMRTEAIVALPEANATGLHACWADEVIE